MTNEQQQSTPAPLDLAAFEGHTPGPWEAEFVFGGDWLIESGNGMLAEVWHLSDSDKELPTEANARLVAAAPALLAEAKRLRAVNAEAAYLIDQLECLAVESHPSLYERAQQWKAANAEGHS